MTGTIFDNHRVFAASIFKDAFANTETGTFYVSFGYHQAWANDAAPPTANGSYSTEQEIWRNMVGAKKLTGNDIEQCVPRYNWTANTIYTQYDQLDSTLGNDNVKFYVVTSDYNVYKCLSNNGNANSTVEPTSVNANNVTQTGDGYIWKFMCQLRTSDLIKFTTPNYIPIRTLTSDNGQLQWSVQENAVEGPIYTVVLTNAGSGYSNSDNLVVTITGDGSSAAATANVNTASNTVHSITMTNYGVGYTNATVTITGGGGTGATGRAIIAPKGGHGSNPAYELHAKNIIINARFEEDENGRISVDNEFRQIALIKDPTLYGTTTISSNNVVKQTLDLSLSGSGSAYIKDEYVYQGTSLSTSTFSGIVQEYDSTNTTVKLTNTRGTPISDPLIGVDSSANKFVTSISYPVLELNSGDILYVDNLLPITRNIDQSEDFKIVVKF